MSWQTPENLSADGIAIALGYASAAAMAAATEAGELATPVTTAGTSTAYTLTDTRVGTPVDGQVFSFIVHTNSGTNPTLNVNGSGARNLAYLNAAGTYSMFASPGMITAETAVIVRYNSAGPRYVVLSQFCMVADSIPGTLNATKFAGDITLPLGGGIMGSSGNSGYTYFCGGVAEGQANGSYISLAGVNWNGDASYYTGNNAGAAHSFFDKNGVEQLRVNESGLTAVSGSLLLGDSGGAVTQSVRGYSSTGCVSLLAENSSKCRLDLYAEAHATYPGAHQQFAPLSTRAASTAFAVCPVATGDTCFTLLMSDGGDVYAEVLISASAAFSLLRGNAAFWVNSSSPAAGEVGVYVSAGVLYCKPGSSFTGKIATFSKIGKA